MKYAILLISLLAPAAWGQAMVENALGAGRAATMAAPAKSMGKSMSGIAGSLDKALKGSGAASGGETTTATTTTVVHNSNPPAKPEPPTIREDANGIEQGLAYDEMIERFGKPAMSITIGGEQSLTYKGIAGMYRVTVRNGKVAAVVPPR